MVESQDGPGQGANSLVAAPCALVQVYLQPVGSPALFGEAQLFPSGLGRAAQGCAALERGLL
eukprot:7101352-Pyramimonas_sp.AAC.1